MKKEKTRIPSKYGWVEIEGSKSFIKSIKKIINPCKHLLDINGKCAKCGRQIRFTE